MAFKDFRSPLDFLNPQWWGGGEGWLLIKNGMAHWTDRPLTISWIVAIHSAQNTCWNSFQSVQYPNCDGALGYGLIIFVEQLFAVFHLSDDSQLMHELIIIVKRGTSLLRGWDQLSDSLSIILLALCMSAFDSIRKKAESSFVPVTMGTCVSAVWFRHFVLSQWPYMYGVSRYSPGSYCWMQFIQVFWWTILLLSSCFQSNWFLWFLCAAELKFLHLISLWTLVNVFFLLAVVTK